MRTIPSAAARLPVATATIVSPSTSTPPARANVLFDGFAVFLEVHTHGVVGEPVSGFVKPTDDGKMTATTVHFGVKVEEKGSENKKSK